jgi:hypothetical protein
VEFEPTNPVFERATVFHAVDRATTGIGKGQSAPAKFAASWELLISVINHLIMPKDCFMLVSTQTH